MPALGSALANTYLLPQAQPLAQPQQQAQPYTDDIGDPEEGLQQVDGVTSQYFDKWAQLKGFAKDVWENYKIDVRYPDPSIPESNRLHRIYLKAIADLKKQGSQLKTSQSMLNASLQRGDLINVDTRKEVFTNAQPGVDVVSHVLDPIVTEANDKLKQGFYDKKSFNEAVAYHDTLKKQLLQKADDNPNQREYWTRQAEGLVTPTTAAKQFAERAPNAAGEKEEKKIDAAYAMMKQRANLINGSSDSYKLSDTVFAPDGGRVLVSEDTKGENYGDGKVVRWEHNVNSGETNLVTKDREGKVTRTPVTSADLMSVVKNTVSSEPRYNVGGEYFDMAADKYKLRKETSEVDASPLIASDAPQRKATVQKQIAGEKAQKEASQLSQLKGEISKMTPASWALGIDDRITKVGSDGVPIKIRSKGVDGKVVYEIENIKALLPNEKEAVWKSFRGMGKIALINFLAKRGVHLGEEVAGQPATAPAKPSGEQTTSKPFNPADF